MSDILKEFNYRRSLIQNLNFEEAQSRLSGFMKWMQDQKETKTILDKLMADVDGESILNNSSWGSPPQVSTPEEVASTGVALMLKCLDGKDPRLFSFKYGILPPYQTNAIQDKIDEIMNRFIDPAVDFIENKLEPSTEDSIMFSGFRLVDQSQYPIEITDSLQRFHKDYPDIHRNAFVMMKFGKSKGHDNIMKTLKTTFEKHGLNALRADDKQYHDDLFPNVLTYIYGCQFGIAVFERLEEDDFNPNVSLEVGYMRALDKSVCLLKDKTLKTLHTDLVGKLYKSFDPQNPEATIPDELEKWLRDKDIISI